MHSNERFCATLEFKKADRLPVIEWAPWWNATIDRWRLEGLPRECVDGIDIMEYFGLDLHKQFWIRTIHSSYPRPSHGKSYLESIDMDSYLKIKKYLYPDNPFNKEQVQEWKTKQLSGKCAIWLTLDGFFWHPRKILGIEEHFYTFYDNPELMHAINRDLLNYSKRVLNEFCSICKPVFITFAEDMSYNKGPMLSKELFDEFIAPYYKELVPILNEYGIQIIIDSDGDIKELVPWFLELDIHGFLPLERQAGVDLNELREENDRLIIIGGFDKLVMHKGEEAMREEFERLMPTMKQGGYIPSCDHQTPPQVSLDNYKIYVKLLKEYCKKAVL